MHTKYGELNVGDIYTAADGSSGEVRVIDVDTYADVEDAVVENREGRQYRIDWFKLMMVRYSKKEA
jgi:hypothetical protein